jgi:hypothetical protein
MAALGDVEPYNTLAPIHHPLVEYDHSASADSLWSLRYDLFSAKLLVWVASIGQDGELRPEAHLYLFDRYWRLAEMHRERGHHAKARALRAKAEEHYRAGGGDGPPYAAAMGMPRPRSWIVTDARSDRSLRPPDDAA